MKPQKPGIQIDLPIPLVFIIQDRTMPMNYLKGPVDIGDAVNLHRFSQRPTAKAQASVG